MSAFFCGRGIIFFGFTLSACSATLDHGIPTPSQATIAEEEATAAAPENPALTITEVIDGTSFGLVGDGIADNTDTFRRLMSLGNRRIEIRAGDYVTGSFSIASNTIVVLEPGTTIRDSRQLKPTERLINITSENVYIDGLGARVISDRSAYTSGEQRHGVFIWGAHHVMIDGLESSAHGGDGFYIGGPSGNAATDVTLRACKADHNRRQGLSITSARRVRVIDCEFSNTRGTSPEFGIDLEPNHAVDVLDDITILRPQTISNQGGGIMVQLFHLDRSSEAVRVVIIDHFSDREPNPFRADHLDNAVATVEYSRAF